jgi:hypothetical protein
MYLECISCDANRGRQKSRLIENSRDLKIYQILVSVSAQSGDTVAKEVLFVLISWLRRPPVYI